MLHLLHRMAIVQGTDYVFVPKVTVILDGVTFASLVATRRYLFLLPKESHAGAGRAITQTTFTVDGKGVREVVEKLLADPSTDIEQLEEALTQLLQGQGLLNEYRIERNSLEEFMLKDGFLSKGIYYRKPGGSRRTIAGVPKADIAALRGLYGVSA